VAKPPPFEENPMEVTLKGIHKSFGAVHANDNISLSIPSGTIQGILGENGAGKSTLMKVLSGFISADRGEILLNGRAVQISSPADAIHHGIGMLHQDPLDFPPMDVIDNFLIGSSAENPIQFLFPDKRKAIQEFQQLQQQFDFSINPRAYVDTLTVGERQQLEILRLLWLGASVLILDEPTTGISAPQKVKLFETLKILASQGKTIIFVSHKLEDVEQLCDRVAVLRRGELVGESVPPYDMDELVQLMFGKLVMLGDRLAADLGEPVLELKNLALEDARLLIEPLALEVNAGEVIGLAGMEGSGQLLFLRACAGLVRSVGGDIYVKGKRMTGKRYPFWMKEGVAYLPASRMEEGLVPGLTLSEHFALARKQKGVFIDRQEIAAVTKEHIADYNIRGVPTSIVEGLSGGNQQRALLALMKHQLSLILMEHPTRGLDIESAIYIWGKLKERCRQSAAILFISSDLEEILQYSDRILVFYAGKVSKPINAQDTHVDQLGQLIGGKGWDAVEV
jgi:general nucleoside transport system ATP-binding protein